MAFVLATLGGEVTLLQTVFIKSSHRWLAYTAVSLVVVAAVFVLGAYEGLILRTCYPRRFRRNLAKLLLKFTPTSATSEAYCRALAGAFHGASLAFFAAFVCVGELGW